MKTQLVFIFSCFVVFTYSNVPLCTEPHEKLDCVMQCPPERSCSNRDIMYDCMPEQECEEKCVCEDGYVRNENYECIEENNCKSSEVPVCDQPNEKLDCVTKCPPERSCRNRGIKFSCVADQEPEDKCVCEDGYVRNERYECIEEENCDVCMEPNEEYTNCKKSCPPEECFAIVAKFKCDSKEPCQTTCACKPGFYRKKNDTSCIPSCECPQLENTSECNNSEK